MDDLDAICNRCGEQDPRRMLEKKILEAGFSLYSLEPWVHSWVKEEGGYLTYLFPKGVETPGTALFTIPKKERKTFEKAIISVISYDQERNNFFGAARLGGFAGLCLGMFGFGMLFFLSGDTQLLKPAAFVTLSFGVVGAVAYPFYYTMSIKRDFPREQACMSAYRMGNAQYSNQVYDPAIIRKAIGA